MEGLEYIRCALEPYESVPRSTLLPVSYTPPRILMDSIRSPDKVLILLMESQWTPDKVYGLLMDSPWTPHGLLMDS